MKNETKIEDVAKGENQAAFTPGEWISVKDRLPSHIYSVLVWVVGGPLILDGDDDGYLDVGIYNAQRGKWQASNGEDDIDVEVSHWQHIIPPSTDRAALSKARGEK